MKVKTCRTATDTSSRKPILLFKGKQQKANQNAYTCQPYKPFSASNQTTTSHLNYIFPLLSPHIQPKGRGEILFWCGSRRRWCPGCSLSAHCLLNQLVEFDQTCTDTLLGGRKEAKILVTLTSFSRSYQHFEIFTKKACLHPIS